MRTSSTVSNRPSTYQKRTYIQKTASINKRLRTGDVTRIAETTGYSTPYVSQVLNGLYFNDRIINAGFDMTRGRITNSVKLTQLATA
jgi:hypothetical protein